MKKGLVLIILAAIAALMLYWFVFDKKEKDDAPKEGPIAVAATDTLTGDIGMTLNKYYAMKNAFTRSDTADVNNAARGFVDKVGGISIDRMETDPAILDLAKQIQKNLENETEQLLAKNDIEAKRKSFEIISDGLFDLLRTVRYDGSKVYQQYCPMAFDNKGAAWLSADPEIVNPYFGEAMLHCGEIRDSVNLVKE